MSQCVSSIIIVQPTPVSVVQVGVPGPSGPTGAPGSASIPILLTETVSGDLAVTSQCATSTIRFRLWASRCKEEMQELRSKRNLLD